MPLRADVPLDFMTDDIRALGLLGHYNEMSGDEDLDALVIGRMAGRRMGLGLLNVHKANASDVFGAINVAESTETIEGIELPSANAMKELEDAGIYASGAAGGIDELSEFTYSDCSTPSTINAFVSPRDSVFDPITEEFELDTLREAETSCYVPEDSAQALGVSSEVFAPSHRHTYSEVHVRQRVGRQVLYRHDSYPLKRVPLSGDPQRHQIIVARAVSEKAAMPLSDSTKSVSGLKPLFLSHSSTVAASPRSANGGKATGNGGFHLKLAVRHRDVVLALASDTRSLIKAMLPWGSSGSFLSSGPPCDKARSSSSSRSNSKSRNSSKGGIFRGKARSKAPVARATAKAHSPQLSKRQSLKPLLLVDKRNVNSAGVEGHSFREEDDAVPEKKRQRYLFRMLSSWFWNHEPEGLAQASIDASTFLAFGVLM
ncbi:hypothetical protein FISHEDRAFT_76736 [Fistulina hepatica ATCC 64428]|uniref:Uncharacterized protein n=1 Tax=Fistulina hepatica ATCC 64428 TaxID=1128425 RepID=A0A0D7A4C3_9AGAR|nr:hypothetical protein FISHEDRAFT_76736 [Fistulina hepatica ATCC 64428]